MANLSKALKEIQSISEEYPNSKHLKRLLELLNGDFGDQIDATIFLNHIVPFLENEKL
jgi:hypothetical protein